MLDASLVSVMERFVREDADIVEVIYRDCEVDSSAMWRMKFGRDHLDSAHFKYLPEVLWDSDKVEAISIFSKEFDVKFSEDTYVSKIESKLGAASICGKYNCDIIVVVDRAIDEIYIKISKN